MSEYLSDEELLESIKSWDYGYDGDSKKIAEALARIIMALKKKGIEAGWFIWWWDESFWLHNVQDDYKHLWRLEDYKIRFCNEVINGSDE